MPTILQLANQVCDLIPVKQINKIFNSDNKTGKLFSSLVISESQNIYESNNWRINQETIDLLPASATKLIPLPLNFDSILHGAVWNKATGYRLHALNDVDFLSIINDPYRGIESLRNYFRIITTPLGFSIEFTFDIIASDKINITYKTNTTANSAAATPLSDFSNDTDVSIYPDSLIRAALHKGMLLNLGMNADYPISEYSRILNLMIAKDSDSSVISLSHQNHRSYFNIPETGYGA